MHIFALFAQPVGFLVFLSKLRLSQHVARRLCLDLSKLVCAVRCNRERGHSTPAEWLEEADRIERAYERFGDRLPGALSEEVAALRARLSADAKVADLYATTCGWSIS